MAADSREKKKFEEMAPRRPAYFWWFLANTLALCFAIVSWFVCLQVFGNPEMPRNYALLKRLGRLPELKRYTALDAPNGNALLPNELYAKFFGVSDEKRARLNALLLRNYMRNFEKTPLLTYIEGDYQVSDVKRLEPSDFFFPGFAIRAQARVKLDDFTEAVGFPVVIEYIFPTKVGAAPEFFQVGDVLEVTKNPNCAAVVHVSKIIADEEPALQLTVIPIAYGPYRIGKGEPFSIEPPTELNPAASLPIWK